jgi:hypothetical protein
LLLSFASSSLAPRARYQNLVQLLRSCSAARDRRVIRFLGASSHDCSLPYDYFLYVNDKRTNDYFLYVDYERTTNSPTTGLHCDPLPASTVYGYTD